MRRLSPFALLAPLSLTFGLGCQSAEPPTDEEDATSADEALCPSGATTRGIDVSIYQGSIDWHAVKKHGVEFGIARVGDGSYVDPDFSKNWKGMKAAGVIRGSYLFFRASEDPIKQANLVLSHLKAAGGFHEGDIPPTLDMEVTDGESAKTIVARMHTFLAHIESALDRTPLIYTSPGFWPRLGNPKSLAHDDLWVANWGVSCPSMPAGGFKKFTFWQYADNGHVPGIGGAVDLDKFNGSLAQLRAYANGPDGAGLHHLGGSIASAPVLARNENGELVIVATTADGSVTSDTDTAFGFAGFSDHGGDFAGAPGATRQHDGAILVVARDDQGAVHYMEQKAPNGSFGGWHGLGGDLAGNPRLAIDEAGAAHVIGVGSDGTIQERIRSAADVFGAWKTVASIPGGAAGLAVGRRADGRLVIAARGAQDGDIYFVEHTKAGWTGAISLSGDTAGDPAIGRSADGRLVIFARGTDGELWQIHETKADGGFSAWKSFGGDLRSPTMTTGKDGRLELFARRSDGELVNVHQNGPDGAWSGIHSLGVKIAGAPAAARRTDGRIAVFARVAGGKVIDLVQKTPGVF